MAAMGDFAPAPATRAQPAAQLRHGGCIRCRLQAAARRRRQQLWANIVIVSEKAPSRVRAAAAMPPPPSATCCTHPRQALSRMRPSPPRSEWTAAIGEPAVAAAALEGDDVQLYLIRLPAGTELSALRGSLEAAPGTRGRCLLAGGGGALVPVDDGGESERLHVLVRPQADDEEASEGEGPRGRLVLTGARLSGTLRFEPPALLSGGAAASSSAASGGGGSVFAVAAAGHAMLQRRKPVAPITDYPYMYHPVGHTSAAPVASRKKRADVAATAAAAPTSTKKRAKSGSSVKDDGAAGSRSGSASEPAAAGVVDGTSEAGEKKAKKHKKAKVVADE